MYLTYVPSLDKRIWFNIIFLSLREREPHSDCWSGWMEGIISFSPCVQNIFMVALGSYVAILPNLLNFSTGESPLGNCVILWQIFENFSRTVLLEGQGVSIYLTFLTNLPKFFSPLFRTIAKYVAEVDENLHNSKLV